MEKASSFLFNMAYAFKQLFKSDDF